MGRLTTLALLFATGCAVTGRSINVQAVPDGKGALIAASATVKDLISAEGFNYTTQPSVRITVFGKGRDMSYRDRPGRTYKFGTDFRVDVDCCNAGYLWLSEDRKILAISLHDVDPPTGLSPSCFNGEYPLTEAEAALLPQ
jgi:hypothetical protein